MRPTLGSCLSAYPAAGGIGQAMEWGKGKGKGDCPEDPAGAILVLIMNLLYIINGTVCQFYCMF